MASFLWNGKHITGNLPVLCQAIPKITGTLLYTVHLSAERNYED